MIEGWIHRNTVRLTLLYKGKMARLPSKSTLLIEDLTNQTLFPIISGPACDTSCQKQKREKRQTEKKKLKKDLEEWASGFASLLENLKYGRI